VPAWVRGRRLSNLLDGLAYTTLLTSLR
jgi:hypothetical protein